MIWALSYGLHHIHGGLKFCNILYDSEFAAKSADSTWKSGGHTGLAKVAGSLYQMLAA